MILIAQAAQANICEQEWRNWGELEARAQGKTLEQLVLEKSPRKSLHQVFLQFVSFNTSLGGLPHIREVAEQFRNAARTDIEHAQGALWACMANNYGVSDTQKFKED